MRTKQTKALRLNQVKTDNVSRRNFVRTGAAAGAAAALPLYPLLGPKQSAAKGAVIPYNAAARTEASFDFRTDAALADRIDNGVQPDNNDAATFTDFSGNYSKALLHDALGVPNTAAVQSLMHALKTGEYSDFEKSGSGRPEEGQTRRRTTRSAPWHSIWKASIPTPHSSLPLQAWPAHKQRPNRWSTTGLRCYVMCRSPNTQRMHWWRRRWRI